MVVWKCHRYAFLHIDGDLRNLADVGEVDRSYSILERRWLLYVVFIHDRT